MGRRPSAKQVAAEAGGHLVRSESWQGINAGDPVVVADTGLVGATWVFRCHVVNRNNGAEWIEVVGGRPLASAVRSFEPSRIYAVTGARGSSGAVGTGKRLSLLDEPRLPFG